MKKILIVDDDTAIREALNKVLRTEGYETALAAHPDDAVSQFSAGDIDLVLLDLHLPTKSGWDLFEWVTGTDPLVPVIIITGRADQCTLAAGAGVGALLEKPVDVDFLLKSVRDLLVETNDARLHRLLGNHDGLRYAAAAQSPKIKDRVGVARRSKHR